MKLKKSLFGYSVKDVDDRIEATNRLIELQRRDIEFLKRDNERLKSVIDSIGKEENERG